MEEGNKLKKTKAEASIAATTIPTAEVKNNNNSSKTKEEGELSSSDDDGDDVVRANSQTLNSSIIAWQNELPAGSTSQFTGSTAAEAEPIRAASVNKSIQGVKAGKSVSTDNPASYVGVTSRSSVQPNHRKSSEKNRGPFVPFVIRFSDDESGSDSEDGRQGIASETKGNGLGVDGSRRPSVSSIAKSQMLQRTIKNKTKVMPRKVSLSRTFVSSMTKINGAIPRNGGPSSVQQKSHVINFNTLNKDLAGQDNVRKQNVHLNCSKLQDLRQLIAIRENELKLKSVQQNKEKVSGSCRDHNIVNINSNTARICKSASADFIQFEPKEPERKRLKVSESHSGQLISDSRLEIPALNSSLVSEKSVLGNCGKQRLHDCGRHNKGTTLGTMYSRTAECQKQDENRGPVFSANARSGVKKGSDIPSSSQCDRNTRPADPSILKEQTAGISSWTAKTLPKKLNPSEIICQSTPRSVPRKPTSGHNLTVSGEFHGAKSGDKALKPPSGDIYKARSLHFPDSNLEKSDTPVNNSSFCNCLDKVNQPGKRNLDLQSILEIEELQDKELEEAQEHRRKCEVEERNALKAYRKAQMALIEANARCSYHYRKRELYATHFRSLMMEDSSLFWSSQPHDRIGGGPNSSNKVSEVNMHLVPASSHQMEAGFDVPNQHRRDLNIQSTNGALQNLADHQLDRQNLASDPCSEPAASTSEPHKDNGVANGVCSPFNDSSISAYEDEETSLFDQKSVRSNLDCQRRKGVYEERDNDINDRNFSVDRSQDSLLLEASLRSQLFARLGVKTSSKKVGSEQSMEPAVERTENNDGGKKMEMSTRNLSFSETENDQHSDLGVDDTAERSMSELPVQINNQCHVENLSSNNEFHATADPLDGFLSTEGERSPRSVTFSCPILRSAFGHMKVTDPVNLVQLRTRSREIHTSDVFYRRDNSLCSNEIKPSILSSNSTEVSLMETCIGEVGSYTCNLAIDPFWPLCMYELRGKCNNDECSWQHVRDYSSRDVNHDYSDNADLLIGSSSQTGKLYDATKASKCLNCLSLAPPTYLVGLDILKADLHSYKSVLARGIGQCWQKCFSASMVLSSLLPTDLPSDEPFLHGSEACIEVHGCWNRQSSYFHSRNGTVSQLDQCLADNDRYLEMALLHLSHEVNKQKGRIEALKVLARALEADPTSVALWVVYLHIYYCNQKSIGKDDMFHYAVEQNEGSYELWIIYINSRIQLKDRLAAYDAALSSLCGHSSSSVSDAVQSSECILDLFLQMMNCLCISGNVGKATEKIYGLFSSIEKSDESHQLFLSDILTCLTICDKCIFWVCCVYLVIYRKLPDVVVQRFEFQKELYAIEWPYAHLTANQKQQAVTLMEMAVDSLALYIDSDSLESETTLKAAHLFAVNHIRCIAVLEGLECSRNLLDKYTKLYPSCLELVLVSARMREHDFGNLSCLGFEEALSGWLEEVPGVQCIWNQYAEFALRNGRFDFVKELMDRWFHSDWKVQYSQSGILDTMDGGNSHGALESASVSVADTCISSQIDVVFGLLNLSLHKILQNDHGEARLAIDRALKVAAAEDYKHCVREHAMFLLADGSQFKEDGPISGILSILNNYLVDARAFSSSEALPRRFIQRIKKPRVQQLVRNLLSPVSSDFSLLNSVLEVWHGPGLLPQFFGKLTDLVDLVEAFMEILPSNYQLAISVCKLLSRGSGSADVSVSVSFWASSLLVHALFQAVPVAPEYVWVEAADILHNLTDIQSISESFHKRALSIYPFSLNLWKSHLKLSRVTGNVDTVTEVARGRGIELD